MEHEDETTAPQLPSHMSEQDLRFNCLSMAHNRDIDTGDVLRRAAEYLKFIKGQEVSADVPQT